MPEEQSRAVCPFYQETAVIESDLHRATWQGNVTDVEQLLAAGVDLHARAGASRTTPLHAAAGRSNTSQVLMAAGADVNAQDADGNTPLIRAARLVGFMAGNMEQLLKAGAQPDIQNNRGRTAMHEAVRYFGSYGDEWRLRVLLKYGAALDVRDHDGFTPIDLAEADGDTALVSFLCTAERERVSLAREQSRRRARA